MCDVATEEPITYNLAKLVCAKFSIPEVDVVVAVQFLKSIFPEVKYVAVKEPVEPELPAEALQPIPVVVPPVPNVPIL